MAIEDKYLIEKIDEEKDFLYDPIDTEIFKSYRMSYIVERKKIDDQLVNNLVRFIMKHKEELNSDRDTLQWFKDDIGEYFSDIISQSTHKKILSTLDRI